MSALQWKWQAAHHCIGAASVNLTEYHQWLAICLCEQAHSALTGPAVSFGIFRGDRLWLATFSSTTAEMSQDM
jgi:hypothetical protein